MGNEHSGHRERLRDRVRKEGLKNFQDYQVLEYVLTFAIPYKDTNEIAHRLINKFGSFYGVLEADEEDLALVKGMGQASAHFVANLRNIFHYYEFDRSKTVSKVIGPGGAYKYIKPFLSNKLVEEIKEGKFSLTQLKMLIIKMLKVELVNLYIIIVQDMIQSSSQI